MTVRRKRKWVWLSPSKLHTFSVQAWNRSQESDWASVTLNLSNLPTLGWEYGSFMEAMPVWWKRSIRVRWAPFPARYRKWFDHYKVFRNDITENGNVDAAAIILSGTDGMDSDYFLAKTYENKRRWWREDVREDKVTNKFTAWNCFYLDEDIVIQSRTEPAHQYEYWIFAYDQYGNPSQTTAAGVLPRVIGYLGPDTATWGKPAKPTWVADRFMTIVHDLNKWGCDVYLRWRCTTGAEYYLIRSKHDLRNVWRFPTRVEHDYYGARIKPDGTEETDLALLDSQYQEGTLHNYWVNTDYDFQIKAVNIPGVGPDALESDWSDIATYPTGHDTEAPDEVQEVAVRRMKYLNIAKGDYAKLTWARSNLAIIGEQVRYYNIYRKKGTEAEANAEKVKINRHIGYANEDPLGGEGATPYTDVGKFEGTHFIDDDVDATSVSGGGGLQGVSTCTFEAPTTDLTVNGTAVSGVINGTIATSIEQAQAGTYSLKSGAAGSGFSNYLQWTNSDIINLDEGYITFYFRTINLSSSAVVPLLRTIEYSGGDYFAIFYVDDSSVSGNQHIWVERRVGGELRRYIYKHNTIFSKGLCNDTWVKIDVRWKIDNPVYHRLEVRINDTTWYSSGTTTYTPQVTAPSGIRFGGDSSFAWYFDTLSIYNNYEAFAVDPAIAYHYWVTAVDTYDYESDVTGPEDTSSPSYDSLNFLPPEIPDMVGSEIDMAHKFKVKNLRSLYSVTLGWTPEDNAIWYQVRIAIKPPGKTNSKVEYDYGKWHYSAYLDEARIKVQSEEDAVGSEIPENYPTYIYPFPIQQGSCVKAQVRAINNAGPKLSSTDQRWSTNGTGDDGEWIIGPIEGDTERPLPVTFFAGECYGIYWFTNYWMSVRLRWRPRPWYEGIVDYQISYKLGSTYANPATPWTEIEQVTAKAVMVDTDEVPYQWVRQYHTFMANDIPGSTGETSIHFAIRPIDDMGNNSASYTECEVNFEKWWWPL